jgi:dTDP-3-amino-3,4,6-trideoxy-alpha-D-glucose transaminase
MKPAAIGRVPFNTLRPREDADAVAAAINRVVASGWYILGPEVEAFEAEFATACGASHAVAVGNGTDAIALMLRALDIGEGDEVITAPLSAAFSALAIMMTGARPVFTDIDPERLTLDPARVESAIGPRTRAIMPVHLYGQAADMRPLEAIAQRHGLHLVEDAAQAHLATCEQRPVGTIGAAGAFSFYPTKNLGALGDGGAVVTNDATTAARIKRLRNGGQTSRYQHAETGVNSRLDELQAAILRARLPYLQHWTARRRVIAQRYRQELAGGPVHLPHEFDAGHVYHLFPVLTRQRTAFQSHLASHSIETLIHYPVPITRQPALAPFGPAECPIADRICDEIVSLPIYPGLSDRDVSAVIDGVRSFAR